MPSTINIDPIYSSVGRSGGTVEVTVAYPVYYYYAFPPDVHSSISYTETTIGGDQTSTTRSYAFTVPANTTTYPKQFAITYSYVDPLDSSQQVDAYGWIAQPAGLGNPTIEISGSNPVRTPGSGNYTATVYFSDAGSPAQTQFVVNQGQAYVTASLNAFNNSSSNFTGYYNIQVNKYYGDQPGVTGSVLFMILDSPQYGDVITTKQLDFYIPKSEAPTPPEPPTPIPVITPEIQVNPVYSYLPGTGGTVSIDVRYVGATETYWGYIDGPYFQSPVTETSYTHLGTDETSSNYRYEFTLPPNPDLGSHDYYVTYSMVLGREYPGEYTTHSIIHLNARERNPVIHVASTNPITTTNRSITATVEYSECVSPENVGYAVVQSQANAVVTNAIYSNQVGETFRGDFFIDLTRDWGMNKTASIEFFTTDGPEARDTLDIYIPRDYSSQSLEVIPPSRSVTYDTTLTTAELRCYYTRFSITSDGQAPDQLSWTYTGNVTSVSTGSRTWDASIHAYRVSCSFALAPNNTNQPVVSSITFAITPSGRTVTYYITQSAFDPGTYSIIAPDHIVVPAEGGLDFPVGTVIYSGIESSAQIGTEVLSSGDVDITSLDIVSTVGNARTYNIDVNPNTGTTPLTSSITWSIKDTPVEATTKVYQDAPFLGIIVTPENSNVAYSNTSTTLYVTYSNALLYGYVTQSPVSTDDLTLVSSTTSGNHIYARYTLNYPANSGNSSISHTATFGMVSGSDTITKTATVNQSGIPSGQGISLNRTNQVIEYYETSTQVIATYYGISSIDAVTLPNINSSEWTATIASYTESAGQVQVTWNIQGTANTLAGSKTITFTFSAAGISSTATFALVQNGTGQSSVDNSTIPAWKDTETEIGGNSWEVLAKDSRGIVLFDERIYKAPDRDTLTVNFNRIAESFLEPREFPTLTTSTPVFYFTALFQGGPGYGFWVVDDWSYEREYLGGKDYENLSEPLKIPHEVAVGQYLVFSLLGNIDNVGTTFSITSGGSTVASGIAQDHTYLDLVTRVLSCGDWLIWRGSELFTMYRAVRSKYVIYYYNKFGGWDSFVIKGPVVPSVNTSRSNYLNYRRNTRTYQVGVVDSYKVNTGILLDSVSPVVGEMTASPRLILHDLKEDKLIPVKVTTNSVEIKTFRNQGRKFAEYQFNLEADLNKIRR